jgi:hypothetical protein
MPLFKTRSAAVCGIDAHPVDVEVDLYRTGMARDFIAGRDARYSGAGEPRTDQIGPCAALCRLFISVQWATPRIQARTVVLHQILNRRIHIFRYCPIDGIAIPVFQRFT